MPIAVSWSVLPASVGGQASMTKIDGMSLVWQDHGKRESRRGGVERERCDGLSEVGQR